MPEQRLSLDLRKPSSGQTISTPRERRRLPLAADAFRDVVVRERTCRHLAERRQELLVPCRPCWTGFRGFGGRGRAATLLLPGSAQGFEVSRGWGRTAMSCVRRFGPRFQGLAMISSEGEPVTASLSRLRAPEDALGRVVQSRGVQKLGHRCQELLRSGSVAGPWAPSEAAHKGPAYASAMANPCVREGARTRFGLYLPRRPRRDLP